MKIRKEFAVLALLLLVIGVRAINNILTLKPALKTDKAYLFHSPKEVAVIKKKILNQGPLEPGEFFLHSDNCKGCHGHDENNYANIDYNGVDINVYDDWVATMMSNSAKDPLWRAKVTHEILVNPGISDAIQNKCTSCHAPMGHYTSKFKGNLYYTLADLYNDTLGLDGVSCTGCHTIGDDSLGFLFSGHIPYDTNHVIYGPFQNPILGPMQLYTGYDPAYSPHVSEGKMCSSCHTLVTQSVDLSGNFTGNSFVEQATYHEWLNSQYSQDFISCQNCHMPQVTDSVVIANGYFGIDPRSPFNRHKFQGANEFMLKLMKENKSRLNITRATDENYDSTIAITNRMLKYQTLTMNLLLDSMTTDTAYFTVRLTNKAGHKFPSGYPSRRAVLQFVVVGNANDTIFKSGMFDPNYEVVNINSTYEPHYDIISDESQAQIYELVVADVTGIKTTVLLRMDHALKDNRLPPDGFTTTHNAYDTTLIVGNALTDPDFNKTTTGVEGTGRDFVHYHVPINNYSGSFNVYSYMYFQSVPPGYLTDMFTYSSAEIDTFEVMYNNADKTPVLVQADSLLQLSLGISTPSYEDQVVVYPDPTVDGWVNIKIPEKFEISEASVFDNSGRLIKTIHGDLIEKNSKVLLPEIKGTYYLELIMDQKRIIKKIIRQ